MPRKLLRHTCVAVVMSFGFASSAASIRLTQLAFRASKSMPECQQAVRFCLSQSSPPGGVIRLQIAASEVIEGFRVSMSGDDIVQEIRFGLVALNRLVSCLAACAGDQVQHCR